MDMSETIPNRRRFLAVCTTALVAIVCGLILAPALAFVTSPLRRKFGKAAAGSDFADAGGMDLIPEGNGRCVRSKSSDRTAG